MRILRAGQAWLAAVVATVHHPAAGHHGRERSFSAFSVTYP
jgi:hypothetical protein